VQGLVTLCLLAATAAPASAMRASSPLVFEFGRKGGTILPFQIAVRADGTVSVTGTVRRTERVTVSPQALAGLKKLALAEQFFTMPATTNCLGTVGGLATNYIRAHIGKRDKTVSVYGGCNKRFVELFEVLEAVAGVSTTPRSP
jgi:hypothetical protein